MPQLLDATVLSKFAAVERLDLLQLTLGTAELAVTVHEEVQRGIDEGYEFLRAVDAQLASRRTDGWIGLTDLEGNEEHEAYARLLSRVQPGEAASLAIAAHRAWTFATDDLAARRIAAEEGVSITGTLGILLQLIEQNDLPVYEANQLLGLMISRAGYRSPITDVNDLLQ
jgi:predicted nucleic acid-binding protein